MKTKDRNITPYSTCAQTETMVAIGQGREPWWPLNINHLPFNTTKPSKPSIMVLPRWPGLLSHVTTTTTATVQPSVFWATPDLVILSGRLPSIWTLWAQHPAFSIRYLLCADSSCRFMKHDGPFSTGWWSCLLMTAPASTACRECNTMHWLTHIPPPPSCLPPPAIYRKFNMCWLSGIP